jgi:hypothetical protein
LPHPIGPRGARNLKFIIYSPLVPKMHHTKEVKNVKMLTGKTTPRIINFTILVLYITMHSVFPPHMWLFENWSILGSFCPGPKAPGGQGP